MNSLQEAVRHLHPAISLQLSLDMRLLKYFSYLALASVVLACDPQTQYEKEDGQCCKKCGPGTRMSESEQSCLDPVCRPCAEDEFQAEYTAETKCDLQPYCDPNKHFVNDGPVTQDKRGQCRCGDGYHCASTVCITCAVHSTCGAGQRVAAKGNHDHDTVCQDCPPGTFSTGGPGDTDCHNWTVCEHGLEAETVGTTTSDTVCVVEPNHRAHSVLIPVILTLLALLGLLGLFACYRSRGCGRKKHSVELGTAEAHIVNVHHDHEVVATAVESDELLDFESLVVSNGSATATLTESGMLVAQERGKSHVVPQQVSQPSDS